MLFAIVNSIKVKKKKKGPWIQLVKSSKSCLAYHLCETSTVFSHLLTGYIAAHAFYKHSMIFSFILFLISQCGCKTPSPCLVVWTGRLHDRRSYFSSKHFLACNLSKLYSFIYNLKRMHELYRNFTDNRVGSCIISHLEACINYVLFFQNSTLLW